MLAIRGIDEAAFNGRPETGKLMATRATKWRSKREILEILKMKGRR
jgi:hypothetical protein